MAIAIYSARILFLPCVFSILLAAPGLAHAQLSVYPMEVSLTGGQVSITTIDVNSLSSETSYITATVKEVLDPRGPHEREVPLDSMQPDELVVLPHKFILAPHASKKLRLVFMRPVDHERVFRVAISGDPGVPVEVSADAASGASSTAAKQVKTHVSVQIQWEPLVRVLPLAPHVAYSARLENGAYLLRNDGNVRFLVRRLQLCSPGAGSCTPVSDQAWADGGNLYPGSEVKLHEGDAAGLRFDIVSRDGDEVKQVQATALLASPVK